METEETEGTDAVSGGIAGENYSTIESCFNEGVIRSECEDGCYAGGITGYTLKCVIKDCFNTGTVSADGNNFASAGGIAGCCDSLSKISTCYNTGAITAQITKEDNGEGGTIEAAGGIVGALASEQEDIVTDCYYLDTSAQEGVDYINGSTPENCLWQALWIHSAVKPFRQFDFAKKW